MKSLDTIDTMILLMSMNTRITDSNADGFKLSKSFFRHSTQVTMNSGRKTIIPIPKSEESVFQVGSLIAWDWSKNDIASFCILNAKDLDSRTLMEAKEPWISTECHQILGQDEEAGYGEHWRDFV